MLFTWGMLFGLIFLFAVPQKACSRLQLTYASVFRWPLAWGRSMTLATGRSVQSPDVSSEEYQDLLENDRQLQTKVANLRAQLQDVQQRYEQLAKLQEKPGWENTGFRQAGILTAADSTQSQPVISRGTDDGVAKGQFVISLSDQGGIDESCSVIGTVSSVGAGAAKIRLITDKGSRIEVGVGALGIRGVLEGQGNRTARVTLSREHSGISAGDPVYAQKQPGLDVPVIAARVTSCQRDRDNPLFWDIRVQPICEVAALRDVVVLVSAPRPQ
jgi:cell shape-determining protein MreC